MAESLLKLQDVSISFDGHPVLSNISFSLQRGEIVTLIGPNGAGKSTLVRIILGLLQADSGTLWRAEALNIGYMPQKLQMDSALPLSVCRFLQLAKTSHRDCHQAMRRVGINHLASTPLYALSGGELQRTLLARAVLRKPNFLVLDEPVQGVDITGQTALYQLIDQISSELNCAVLMVSHDLHVVMSASNRVICLNGHICCQGMPGQIQSDPSFQGIFGANSAVYTHHHNHHHNLQGNVVEGSGEGCCHD